MAFSTGERTGGRASDTRPSGKGAKGLGKPVVSPASLRHQYLNARDRLDRAVELMHWARELRSIWRRDFFTAIHLDTDSVKREVEHFRLAVSRHERRQS